MPPTLHHAITALISRTSLALTTENERNSKRGNGKGEAATQADTTPDTSPDTTGDPTSLLGTIGGILTANPILIPVLLIAALIGINIGWRRLTAHQNERGRPLRPLGAITKDTIKFALREDTRPLHSKIPYLTGRRTYLALTLTGVLSVLYPGHHLGIAWVALPALIYARAAKVFKARQAVIRQMFDVAHGECKYDKNAFLAPWTRINVQNWENLTSPGLTVVTIPAAYQSEDLKTREKFERQFNGTISEANSWTYTWESAKNRIVCKPASFLPTMAPYPGPNEKWDTIDLGIKMDGTVASYSVSEFPHSLICGPTGSGKSVLQRMVLFHCLSHSDTWKIVGVDPKMVEMSWLKKYDNVLQIALTLEESIEVITQVRDEMKRRYEEMSETGVVHFKKLASPPPALMLMVDETFNLLAPEGVRSDEGKERDALHAQGSTLLGEIARLGRAAGVYLVLATQRPDATVIKGEMKNNLDCRIAAGKMDNTPSLMVLDSEAATRLPKIKGRGMLRTGGDLDTFQGFFAEQSWFDEQLAARAAAADGVVGEGLDAGSAAQGGDEEASGTKSKVRGRRGLLAALTAKAEQRAAAMDSPADAVADAAVAGPVDLDEAPESWVDGEPGAAGGAVVPGSRVSGVQVPVVGSEEVSAGEGLSISGEFGSVDGLDDLGELDDLGSFDDFGDLAGLDDLDGLGDFGTLDGLDDVGDVGDLDQLGEMRTPGEPAPLVEPRERTQEDSPAVDSGVSVAAEEPAQGDSPAAGGTDAPSDLPAPVAVQPEINRPRLPSVAAVPPHGTVAPGAPSATPRRRLGAPVTTSTPAPGTAPTAPSQPSQPSQVAPGPSLPPSPAPTPSASPVPRSDGDEEGSIGGPATGQDVAVPQPSGSGRLPTSPPPRRLPTAPPPRT